MDANDDRWPVVYTFVHWGTATCRLSGVGKVNRCWLSKSTELTRPRDPGRDRAPCPDNQVLRRLYIKYERIVTRRQ